MNLIEQFDRMFGSKLSKKAGDTKIDNKISTFIAPDMEGAISIDVSGFSTQLFDIDTKWKNTAELINQYRTLARTPEAEAAIDDIVNEAIVFDINQDAVNIALNRLDQPDNVKEIITEEFENVLKRFDFNYSGDEFFRKWYTDGRIFFQVVVDEGNLKKGIKDLRYIDSRLIQFIKEVEKETTPEGHEVIKNIEEYYLYSEEVDGINRTMKIAPEAIVYADSGLFEGDGTAVSYLHKAIKPINQLNMLEDAATVYRITRSPERRVFYVDVGNLPKTRAEQYLKNIMNKYKNKMVYDSNTGKIKDQHNTMSMLEDFWLPRREGGKGTEIETLPAGGAFDQIDDILYFRKKVYKALHVPASRLEDDASYGFGKQSEITRDEIKFTKFVMKLRKKFSNIFYQALRTQLILKGVIKKNEWRTFKENIDFEFKDDSFFSEMKQTEILKERLEIMDQMVDYAGKYFSHEYIRASILQQTEDEIKDIDAQIKDEKNDERYKDEDE